MRVGDDPNQKVSLSRVMRWWGVYGHVLDHRSLAADDCILHFSELCGRNVHAYVTSDGKNAFTSRVTLAGEGSYVVESGKFDIAW